MSSSNGLEKYPKLRFPGFDEPWEETPLSACFVKNIKKNTDGSVVNVICNSAKQGLIPQRDYFDKDIANSNNTNGYYIIEQNDFVYNPRKSSDAPYGPISRYDYAETGIVSPLYLCFRAKENIDTNFFEWYFRSTSWHRYIYMTGDSGARHDRVSIKDDDFFSMPICFPSAVEQEKIASFLNTIEERITSQKLLVDNLKKYKRGAVMQLLSSKSCPLKNVKWTTAKMSELGSFVKGAPLSKADIADDGTPFILYGELYTTYTEVVTSIKRRTRAKVDVQYLSRVGDVVIPTSGETPEEISTASCIMLPGVILAGDLNIFRSDKVDGRIMSYLLNHVANAKIARIAQGKSVVHIQASELGKLTLSYPDENTQRKLIGILSKLDDNIVIEEDSLTFLTDLKIGLMQQLFI